MQNKIEGIKTILDHLEVPDRLKGNIQILSILALLDIKPEDSWTFASQNSLRITDIISSVNKFYDSNYKENTRETFRKNVMYPFMEACFIVRNLDDRNRSPNSGNTNYSLTSEFIGIVKCFPTGPWKKKSETFLDDKGSLLQKYNIDKNYNYSTLTLLDGRQLDLSIGNHNKLQIDIIEQLIPTFFTEPKLLYLGDTGNIKGKGGRHAIFESSFLKEFGVNINEHTKLPDIIVYEGNNNGKWVAFIEACNSKGHISPQRYLDLKRIIDNDEVVFITAFHTKKDFLKFLKIDGGIAWETEVWIADNPTHMIHFNGDKFLGPHTKKS